MAKPTTEAPTSGITKTASESAIAQADKLTEEMFDFVNLLHQHYSVHGTLCTAEVGEAQYGIPSKRFTYLIAEPRVVKALLERGIDTKDVLDGVDDNWRSFALSGEQLIVANTMLDLLDSRSYKKKLQDLGVKTTKWQAWLKEPAFAEYLDQNTQAVLRNGQHEAALALMDKVQQGDLKAIQFYWEYTGRFIRQADKSAGNVQAEMFDAKQLISDLVEIIVDEVNEPGLAARIADRLKNLITRNQIVQQLQHGTDEPVSSILPEVAPARELTPRIEALMHKGVGMDT